MEKGPQQNIPGVPNYTPEQIPGLQAALEQRRKLQRPLMMEAARQKYPAMNEKELKGAVLEVWTSTNADSQDSLAASFARFMDHPDNQNKEYDISTPEKLQTLLKEIEAFKPSPDTLH